MSGAGGLGNKTENGSGLLPAEEFEEKLAAALALAGDEARYARHWDEKRKEKNDLQGGAELYDSQKPVEAYILWMEDYLAKARAAVTAGLDKTEALEDIRKAAGLAISCMIHNETPPRIQPQ